MNIEEIRVNRNGPLKIVGSDIELVNSEGEKIDIDGRDTIFLCRCGQSNNKPFCDGTHKQELFDSK